MKKNLTLLLACFLLGLTQVGAQSGTEIYVLDLKIDGITTTYKEEACGFSAPDDWGGPIEGDFCLPIVWGYDGIDSLGCDTTALVGDYAGKAVMIRRGVCEFGFKALKVQTSGGAMAVIVNGTAATHGDGCNQPGMGAGAVGAQVTDIPAVMICRNMADVIDAAIKANKNPMICVRRLSLHDPSAEYAYATPVSQADTVELITVSAVNRTGVGQDFTAKAEITDPAGNVTIVESTQFVEAGADSIFYFPSYVPEPLVGTFSIKYTVDQATNVGDTVYRKFILTPHTFAADNLVLNGGAANDATFTGNKIYSAASLYKTGDAGLTINYASFGINNAAAVAVADASANVVSVVLYDADVDNNGRNDLGTGLTAFDNLGFAAFHDFTFDANTPVDEMINVPLEPAEGTEVVLKPNHFYYIRLIYNGVAANTGKQLSFTVSRDANYDILFDGVGAITPITLDNLYTGGWGGATVVARIHDKDYDPQNPVAAKQLVLDKSKYSVTPNPAVDYASVNLDLANLNKSVIVSLVDFNGQIVATQTLKNFRNGQIKFNTTNLPSGFYAVSIRSSEEGSTWSNLMICH